MEYKIIPGTDYWITNTGVVYSVKFNRTKELKPQVQSSGYHQVAIHMNGIRELCYVHRLVATLFLENPMNYDVINHKDGNKTNNAVENLQWSTHTMNALHAYETALKKGGRTLNYEKALEIRASELGTKLLSKIYKVSRNTILNIKKNKIWRTKTSQTTK